MGVLEGETEVKMTRTCFLVEERQERQANLHSSHLWVCLVRTRGIEYPIADTLEAQRERAPLGAKTTNVKANAFKTPMPKTGNFNPQKTQIRSTSARKHKLKVHQPEVITAEPIALSEEEEEPEIEYCPPKITPMLDLPEIGFSPNHKFPELNRLEFLADVYEESHDRYDPIGEDGLRTSQREVHRKRKEWEEESDRLLSLIHI